MTKSESFSWQPTIKGCTGLNDFGLLRDKPEQDPKPKAFSLYYSRTVLIVGLVAGFTFAICLTLADKYQKSANISHHYASYIYKKDGGKVQADAGRYDESDAAVAATASPVVDDAVLRAVGLRRSPDNASQRNDRTGHSAPPITVLRPVNGSRGARAYPAAAPSTNSVRGPDSEPPGRPRSNGGLNLADLLRTELKPAEAEQRPARGGRRSTTEANAMQFAQLENYRHHVNAKDLQQLLKYVTCPEPGDCGRPNAWPSTAQGGADAQLAGTGQDPRIVEDDRRRLQAIRDLSFDEFNGLPNTDTLTTLASESNVPVFYMPYDAEQRSKMNIFERLHDYRVSNPMDINDLEPMTSTEHRFFHRFSNRMYHTNRDVLETPRMYTSGLEPYLKPPTPPPTALSFTPSYTTAIFQGYEDGNNPHEELKAEATAVQPTTQIKPISLMVEIFPATDYELPGSYKFSAD